MVYVPGKHDTYVLPANMSVTAFQWCSASCKILPVPSEHELTIIIIVVVVIVVIVVVVIVIVVINTIDNNITFEGIPTGIGKLSELVS